MLMKIRCIYWKRRDRGKGRQTILLACIICVSLLSVIGLGVRNLILFHHQQEKISIEQGVGAGVVTSASIGTEDTISENNNSEEDADMATSVQTPDPISIDTSGLDNFLGFMSDAAYASMTEQLLAECETRQCTSAKKMDYQQTKENSFDVMSFILLSDGFIYKCDYNLKSDLVSITPTNYSEEDIEVMHTSEIRAEQEELEKQQRADRKKKEQAVKKKKIKKQMSPKKLRKSSPKVSEKQKK